MAITDHDISIVFQGPVLPGAEGTAACIQQTRRLLPRSRYVLSTWDHADAGALQVDCVVRSEDPGGLPGIKRRDGAALPNNVNRQILSTRHGLAEAHTRYAMKIRTDCALEKVSFLQAYERFLEASGRSRILTSSLFTIDPSMFEQLPYHISDCFQFGETTALQTYWSGPFMSPQDATYYETRSHAPHSTFMDRRFRSRLAVEQFIAVHYAALCGYPIPAYHNDLRTEVVAGYRRCLAEQFLILDPWDLGLRFSKYSWAYHSSFQQLNCFLAADWYQLYLGQGGRPVKGIYPSATGARRRQKDVARLLGKWFDKAGPFLLRPALKPVVNRLLAILAWQGGRSSSLPTGTRSTLTPFL
jgi:hypothetical protein